ncbi:MAG: glycoside hydrolase family 127 protein [Verrucomicrobia bacterium]|nr:glycoside hydrolase family 127 protein [Verrucomicrobiota bacterium]
MKSTPTIKSLAAGAGFLATVLIGANAMAALITPVPEKVPCAVADRQDFQIPDRVQLTGWLGARIAANASNRLAKIDTARLLEGYKKRPGRQSWDGEHVGKWLHAATLAWVNTSDPKLRAKLDEAVAELCQCQLADGYLGTYLDQNRWTDWDVWSHKYNLLGLVTYMRYTGNLAPLPTCRRMADLLCQTFGDGPGGRDIIPAGHHVGMAPTSVLEPMVLLYRLTGEARYLEFCNYLVRSWEQPNGPHIVSRLLDGKGVNEVGNGKAYEMLSCLNGALELYRTTGERKLLVACENAWQDIVAHRLYLTGAASYCEVFHDEFDLPNVNKVGETCVTVTWLQLNAQLLRLTGEARFAEQLEHVVLNQLLGAQQPDGAGWGYYVQMEGKKPYSTTLDGHCCLSSGPRGVALLPTCAVTTDVEGAVINLFDAGNAQLTLRDGTPVKLSIKTGYPADGCIRITVAPAERKEFSIKLRLPAWCQESSLKPAGAKLGADGYTVLRRKWETGDTIELNLKLEPRVVVGDHLNQGKATRSRRSPCPRPTLPRSRSRPKPLPPAGRRGPARKSSGSTSPRRVGKRRSPHGSFRLPMLAAPANATKSGCRSPAK